MNRTRRVPPSSRTARRSAINKRGIPSNTEPSSKVVRRNQRSNVEQSIDVLEVFRSDGIDVTAIERNYYVEAFTLYMTANMPPILGYLEIPYELIGTLGQLVAEAKANLEEDYRNPNNYTQEDEDYVDESDVDNNDIEEGTSERESYRRVPPRNRNARDMNSIQQPRNSSSGRSVRVRTSKSRRTGGGREW